LPFHGLARSLDLKSKGVALTLVCALVLARPAAAEDWVVGANVGNVPWEFQDARGEFVGFEIEMVTEAARRVGRSVKIENIPFNGLFSAVQSGRVQIAISSITITPKRLASLAFAQPYYDGDQSLSVLKTTHIDRLEDLAGKVVGVDTASTGDIYATEHASQYRIASISRYEGLAPAMLDLAAGRIDGYISDIPAVEYYIRNKPQYRVAVRIPTGERYSFMFARNFADARRVDEALTAMKKEGFVARTHQKWFGSLPAPTSSSVKVMDVPKL
jgi:polar amino acid transport system substrate-binding protein